MENEGRRSKGACAPFLAGGLEPPPPIVQKKNNKEQRLINYQ